MSLCLQIQWEIKSRSLCARARVCIYESAPFSTRLRAGKVYSYTLTGYMLLLDESTGKGIVSGLNQFHQIT